MWGEATFMGSAMSPMQGSGALSVPKYLGLLYLRPNGLTQSDQIRHGNTCGEVHVSEGQPRPPFQEAEPHRSQCSCLFMTTAFDAE